MKKLSKNAIRQAGAEVVTDIMIKFNMLFFERLKEALPEKALELKADYEEYIRTTAEFQRRTKGNYSIADVRESIPANRWGRLIMEVFEKNTSRHQKKSTRQGKVDLTEEIAKRLLGIDIN